MHIGSTISHYRIVEKLGEGGMGVVYKAEDTTLERAVALKFLADHLLNDAEAKQRFLREAKAAAALHHPNVCPVYEIAEADGKTFLAMAFLQGETLEDRVAKGPLAIKDALDIARQVAEGLQSAHAAGIVHRDIKPANIIVSPEGRPTIMDFGLARLTEASRLTKVDTAMGTVAYMSPEQAQGMEVDSRTDIWALGCVLYEMVSGQRPFLGQYDQALLYEIVHEEPAALTGLRTGVPVELELLVAKCLEKEREDRYGSSEEVSRDLRKLGEKLRSGRSTILRTSQMTGAIPATMTAAHTLNPAGALPPDAVVMPRSRHRALIGIAALLAVALAATLGMLFTQGDAEAPRPPTRRFSITQEGVASATLSPDGQYLLIAVEDDETSSLWLRPIGSEVARPIAGTDGARANAQGWSPDSRSIVFATRTEVKRVDIAGDQAITLGELPGTGAVGFRGVSWSPGGQRIVFSSAGGNLYEISARGGEPRLLLGRRLDNIQRDRVSYPHFLPADGGPEALLYESGDSIAILNLETGESVELTSGSRPIYSREGHIIHGPADLAESGLHALPFSRADLVATAESFPIGVDGRSVSLATDGTLAYLDGSSPRNGYRVLVWRDRTGALIETVGQPQPGLDGAVISPDGRRVAVSSTESGDADIWIHDLTRAVKTRLTFDSHREREPVWAPSGREIAYRQYTESGGTRIDLAATDGSGEARTLAAESPYAQIGFAWSHDGRYFAFQGVGEGAADPSFGIRYIEMPGEGGASVTFLDEPPNERSPAFSPDGRFLAYTSNESGEHEIYIRPFPAGDGKWQVSSGGGQQPRWSSDGRELFYIDVQRRLMSVLISTASGVTLGEPTPLFAARGVDLTLARSYDISQDGQKILMTMPVDEGGNAPTIRIVQNWYEEFRYREQ